MHSHEPLALLYFPGTVRIWCVTKRWCLVGPLPQVLTVGTPISLPRRPAAPAQPGACCCSIIPTCLPVFWEHTGSQSSHQPLIWSCHQSWLSSSLSRWEVFTRKPISRWVPERMEGTTESHHPLHCGLSEWYIRLHLLSVFLLPSKHPTKTNSYWVSGSGFQTWTQCLQVPWNPPLLVLQFVLCPKGQHSAEIQSTELSKIVLSNK